MPSRPERHVAPLFAAAALLACGETPPVVTPPQIEPQPVEPEDTLREMTDDQVLVYELQEDYASWAARRGRCASDPGCLVAGRCSPTPEGRCVARTAMDCLWGYSCARLGLCTPDGGSCRRGPPPYYGSLIGVEGGHSEQVNAFLFERPITAKGLRNHYCSSVPLGPPPYPSRNLLGCRFSQACGIHERCLLEAGECRHQDSLVAPPAGKAPEAFSSTAASGFLDDLVAPPEHWQASRGRCADADACFEEGRCSPRGGAPDAGECVATRLIDCMFSTACRDEGRCRPSEGSCVAGGRALFDRVTPSPEEHAARLALFEAEGGAHTRSPRFSACYFASNLLECRHSRECTDEGRCYHHQAACVAATDAACRRSTACRDHGRCRFDPAEDACVADGATAERG